LKIRKETGRILYLEQISYQHFIMGDALYAVHNAFYLGAYQTAISEASQLTGLSDAQKLERDVFVYRSYMELGSYELIFSEVDDSSPLPLQAVKTLASYLKNPDANRDSTLKAASSWSSDPTASSNSTCMLIAGLIYTLEENYVEALKCCHCIGASLEMKALTVQCYLRMHRIDQADKMAKSMISMDDEATLTQLATAWVGVNMGGVRVQEAFYIYSELGDKFVWTAKLHAGLAACQMRMGRWEDAEAELLQAFDKAPKDADVLSNLVVVSLHLGKPATRYMGLLKAAAPQHHFCARVEAAEEAFAKAASTSITA